MIKRHIISRSNVDILLLAAGGSKRLGGIAKQLLNFKGHSLLRNAAETALASICRRVTVVLGRDTKRMKLELKELPLQITVNQDWKNGIGSSINSGISAILKASPAPDAVLILLCDQPLVTETYLNTVIKAYQMTESLIVASQFGNTFGTPALFSKQYFSELLELNSDSGAKQIIRKHFSNVLSLRYSAAGFDIDTSEDYRILKEQVENNALNF